MKEGWRQSIVRAQWVRQLMPGVSGSLRSSSEKLQGPGIHLRPRTIENHLQFNGQYRLQLRLGGGSFGDVYDGNKEMLQRAASDLGG